jgi:hypothetical protein
LGKGFDAANTLVQEGRRRIWAEVPGRERAAFRHSFLLGPKTSSPKTNVK